MVLRGRKSCTMNARMALVMSFDLAEDSLHFSAMLHGFTLAVATTMIELGHMSNQSFTSTSL
jgi:hypothetical protein